ncbi:MAG: DNA polymerase IV [Bacillota bacterium]|nr:DNA polymerase IV [Bacillota bacterium]
MPRTIAHVDMDAFFAAVEVLDHPEYRGKPLIVGGPRGSRRGVVSTCSYEARRYGVRSAMPLSQAARLCPDALFVPGRMTRYAEVAEVVRRVFHEFTPLVEPVSIDEAFLDLTGAEHLHPSLPALGRAIKDRIAAATGGLTASVGIAPNKFLAKLGSELCKPDGLLVVTGENLDSLLLPLPVGRLWGVGPKTEAELNRYGIKTVADLRRTPVEWLVERFGKFGPELHQLAYGLDDRPVSSGGDPKSLGHEETFPTDLSDPRDLRRVLVSLAGQVGRRLRQHGFAARTVTLKFRYADFTTLTRSRTLSAPFDDDDTLLAEALKLWEKVEKKQAFRLLGLYASGLVPAQQLSLLPDRKRQVLAVMDELNTRFRREVVVKGRQLE